MEVNHSARVMTRLNVCQLPTNTALMTDHGRHGETWNIPLNVKCLQPVRSLTAGIMETRCAYMEELLHVCQVSLVHVKLYYIYIYLSISLEGVY